MQYRKMQDRYSEIKYTRLENAAPKMYQFCNWLITFKLWLMQRNALECFCNRISLSVVIHVHVYVYLLKINKTSSSAMAERPHES